AATRELVVNLVTEEMLDAVNLCSADFPAGESEVEAAGLELLPSHAVRPPRVAASPAQLECRLHTLLLVGANRLLVAEVLQVHARDDLIDPARWRVRTDRLGLVGRMHGPSWYARTGDLLERPRVSYEDWLAARKGQERE
ncbi:MAG TPA: flavin reductase family protein, partial [Deinococcales bacterium]|nr:flavin reductase family protein [Deinococcales bacterium]